MTVSQISNGEIGSSVRTKLNSVVAIANALALGVTREEMASLDASIQTVAFLDEDNRQGLFKWDSSDLSTEVSVDTLQGIYVAPLSDETGASGAWVRILDGYVTPEMFGAVGNIIDETYVPAAADDGPSIRAAQAFIESQTIIRELYFPSTYAVKSLNPASSSPNINAVQSDATNCVWRSIQGRNGVTFWVYLLSNTTVLDCSVRVNGSGTRWENVTVINYTIGTPATPPTAVVRAATGSPYPYLMSFINCGFKAKDGYLQPDYAWRGYTWGLLLDTCEFVGGTNACCGLDASTSCLLIHCYANGKPITQSFSSEGYTKYGFALSSFYGTVIDCSADNISGGIAYHFADRQWSCMGLAAEQFGSFLDSTATTLSVSGAHPFSAYTNTTPWQASHAYSLGNVAYPTTGGNYFYVCTAAGTSDASEPVWPTTIGDTVTDGGVTWKLTPQQPSYSIVGGQAIVVGTNQSSNGWNGKIAQVSGHGKLILESPRFGYEHCIYVDSSGNDLGYTPDYFNAIICKGRTCTSGLPYVAFPLASLSTLGIAGEVQYPISVGAVASQKWTASKAYVVGSYAFPTGYFVSSPLYSGAPYVYQCTTAGTSDSSEPTWPTSGTVTDGTVVWTTVDYTSNSLGPFVSLTGSSPIIFDGHSSVGRAPMRFIETLKFINCTAPIIFKKITFDFDLNDATAFGISMSAANLKFAACDFVASSPLKSIFGPRQNANLYLAKGSVTIDPDCRLISNGNIVGDTRNGHVYYWRSNVASPMCNVGSSHTAPIELYTVRNNTPQVPLNTIWDGDIDPTFEVADSNRYLAMKCTRSGWSTIPWVANTAYALGDTVVPTVDNTYYYECTTAGTSDASTEPIWPTGTGATVTDGTVVWTRKSTAALFKGYNQIEA